MIILLNPDSQNSITVEYDDDGLWRVDAVVVSSQHSLMLIFKNFVKILREKLFLTTVPAELIDENTKFYINPTGRFVVSGPNSDGFNGKTYR